MSIGNPDGMNVNARRPLNQPRILVEVGFAAVIDPREKNTTFFFCQRSKVYSRFAVEKLHSAPLWKLQKTEAFEKSTASCTRNSASMLFCTPSLRCSEGVPKSVRFTAEAEKFNLPFHVVCTEQILSICEKLQRNICRNL